MRIKRYIALLVSLLATLYSLESVAEELGTRKTVYTCDIGTGKVFSVEPCASGKEIDSKEAMVYPSGLIDFVPPTKPTIDISPRQSSVNSAPQPSDVAGEAKIDKDQTSKRRRLALVTLIAYCLIGLVFGIIAKLRRRSFLRWFFVGFIVAVMFGGMNGVQP